MRSCNTSSPNLQSSIRFRWYLSLKRSPKHTILFICVFFYFSMNKLFSGLACLWINWWKNLWFAQKAGDILSDWFDISKTTKIVESDLEKIFGYKLRPNTRPFFIIATRESNIQKRKFAIDDIGICYSSDWFGLIRPNDSSHIIMPSQNKWITFNAKKQCISVRVEKWKVWWLWGWTFQLDKNIGQDIIYSGVGIKSMKELLEKTLI